MARSSDAEKYARISEELRGPDTSESKFQRKLRESPFMVAGIAGGTGVAAYGFYNIRNSKIRLSYYLMQLRVIAQGTIILMLLGGTSVELYGRVKRMYIDPPPKEDE